MLGSGTLTTSIRICRCQNPSDARTSMHAVIVPVCLLILDCLLYRYLCCSLYRSVSIHSLPTLLCTPPYIPYTNTKVLDKRMAVANRRIPRRVACLAHVEVDTTGRGEVGGKSAPTRATRIGRPEPTGPGTDEQPRRGESPLPTLPLHFGVAVSPDG